MKSVLAWVGGLILFGIALVYLKNHHGITIPFLSRPGWSKEKKGSYKPGPISAGAIRSRIKKTPAGNPMNPRKAS